MAFTIAVLVADLSKTDSWTLTRQNLDTLTGELRCGLADDALIANTASMRGLEALNAPRAVRDDDALEPAPVEGLPRFTLGPAASPALPAASPWFAASEGTRIGVFLGGTPAPSDRLYVEWGRAEGGRIAPVGGDRISVDHGPDGRFDLVPWRFLPAASLPARPTGADAVRLVLNSDPMPGGVVALTAPVSYENAPLVDFLERERSPVLVLPNLALYLPCADQPDVSGGVAEPPGTIVGLGPTIWPVTAGTSPFDALPRLYPLMRLPLTDSPDPPLDVAVYLADPRIAGALQAPAEPETVTS